MEGHPPKPLPLQESLESLRKLIPLCNQLAPSSLPTQNRKTGREWNSTQEKTRGNQGLWPFGVSQDTTASSASWNLSREQEPSCPSYSTGQLLFPQLLLTHELTGTERSYLPMSEFVIHASGLAFLVPPGRKGVNQEDWELARTQIRPRPH